jgi:hypothetical protein
LCLSFLHNKMSSLNKSNYFVSGNLNDSTPVPQVWLSLEVVHALMVACLGVYVWSWQCENWILSIAVDNQVHFFAKKLSQKFFSTLENREWCWGYDFLIYN